MFGCHLHVNSFPGPLATVPRGQHYRCAGVRSGVAGGAFCGGSFGCRPLMKGSAMGTIRLWSFSLPSTRREEVARELSGRALGVSAADVVSAGVGSATVGRLRFAAAGIGSAGVGSLGTWLAGVGSSGVGSAGVGIGELGSFGKRSSATGAFAGRSKELFVNAERFSEFEGKSDVGAVCCVGTGPSP